LKGGEGRGEERKGWGVEGVEWRKEEGGGGGKEKRREERTLEEN
jgi:hypothetical protein